MEDHVVYLMAAKIANENHFLTPGACIMVASSRMSRLHSGYMELMEYANLFRTSETDGRLMKNRECLSGDGLRRIAEFGIASLLLMAEISKE